MKTKRNVVDEDISKSMHTERRKKVCEREKSRTEQSTWIHLYSITCYFLHLISILCIVFIEIGYSVLFALYTWIENQIQWESVCVCVMCVLVCLCISVYKLWFPINDLHCKWRKHDKGGTLNEGTTTSIVTIIAQCDVFEFVDVSK